MIYYAGDLSSSLCLCLYATFLSVSLLSYLLPPSPLSLSLSRARAPSEMLLSIFVSSKRYNIARLFAHRRTTDNFAKLRAGCLIAFARHSGSANSRCIRGHVFAAVGYLLNPLLHRFAKPARTSINFTDAVASPARISITRIRIGKSNRFRENAFFSVTL